MAPTMKYYPLLVELVYKEMNSDARWIAASTRKPYRTPLVLDQHSDMGILFEDRIASLPRSVKEDLRAQRFVPPFRAVMEG